MKRELVEKYANGGEQLSMAIRGLTREDLLAVPAPDANGCTVGSTRHESGRWPNMSSTSFESVTCRSIGNSPRMNESSISRSRSSAISGTSSCLISPKMRATSADFISGSKSSSSTSYGSPSGSMHSM